MEGRRMTMSTSCSVNVDPQVLAMRRRIQSRVRSGIADRDDRFRQRAWTYVYGDLPYGSGHTGSVRFGRPRNRLDGFKGLRHAADVRAGDLRFHLFAPDSGAGLLRRWLGDRRAVRYAEQVLRSPEMSEKILWMLDKTSTPAGDGGREFNLVLGERRGHRQEARLELLLDPASIV